MRGEGVDEGLWYRGVKRKSREVGKCVKGEILIESRDRHRNTVRMQGNEKMSGLKKQ